MKSLMWLISSVLAEAGTKCDTDTHLDYKYVVERVEHEGLSFLTITLPTLSHALERGLEVGRFEPLEACAFKRMSKGTLPAFLQGLFVQVFDNKTGVLLKEPSVEAISCIRQVCLMWKKVNIACSEERVNNAFEKFLECERDIACLPDWSSYLPYHDQKVDRVRMVAGILWHRLGSSYSDARRTDQLMPRHGPGATAERISGNRKFALRSWYSRLQDHFPLDLFACVNWSWLGDPELERINIVEPEEELPVRVTAVPKTLKTPRIIAIEPVCMQYVQQALMAFLVEKLENSWFTAGHVNFTDQSINQRHALSGSRNGTSATLDLKEASDRVSLNLVRLILGQCPDLLGALESARSTKAILPSGVVIPLSKYASQGSATCFPVEAMVFFTLVVSACTRQDIPVTPQGIRDAIEGVYVYGDDLIVPKDKVLTVLEYLKAFGLKVNDSKSFWTGKFRESCGMDAYAGEMVTPIYLRELPQYSRSKRALGSLVSFANQLYGKGWWHTARSVREWIEANYGPLPHVLSTSAGLGWHSFLGSYTAERWDPKAQVFKVKTYVVSSRKRHDPVEGHAGLLKYFLSVGKPDADEDFQEGTLPCESNGRDDFHMSVRRGDVHTKHRWVRPY